MKTRFPLFITILTQVLLFSFSSKSQYPQIKWHYDVGAPSFGQAAMADIDNDGKPEIVFSTYMGDGTVYALNAEDGSLLWKYYTGSCNDAAPVIYDVDGDGKLEVIIASSCIPFTYCFDGATGALKWKTPTGGTDSPPTIGDVDNDGKVEILQGEFNGNVLCLKGEDGSKKWEQVIDPSASIQTSPTLVDINNDGQLDFVVATWGGYYPNYYSNVYAFRGDTHTKIWESATLSDDIYHGASFGDIDGDGKPEVVIGCYNDTVYAFNAEDGSTKWKFNMGPYCYVAAPTVMADINNDNRYEIIATGWYEMKAISDSGTEVWSYQIPNYASCFRGPAISDINNDGFLDVVFGTDDGNVIALNGNDGSEIWKLDLAADYGDTLDIDHAPVIGDFDGDGKLEGFVVGGHTDYPDTIHSYGRAYAFSLGEGTGPEWSMFQHDIVRSNRVPIGFPSGIAKVNNTDDIIIDAAPNPFNDDLRMRVALKTPGAVQIYLLDFSGRTIKTLFDILYHHGDTVYDWDCKDVSLDPGMYFLMVTSGGESKVIKVIKQ